MISKRPQGLEGSFKEVTRIPGLPDNALRAKLAGAVRITIRHGDRVMTSASLTDLELVRTTPDLPHWYLPEPEVRRAKRAAGF